MLHLAAALFVVTSGTAADHPIPIVIAHRGASGYLPEHTLEAVSLAYGMKAHYIEQDIVLTADDQAIVLHDIHLDTVTNVAKRFPRRAREDGRFYAIDFTLTEIKTLHVHERTDHKTGKPVFPSRFPFQTSATAPRFQIPTLEEEIELIQGLNKSTGGRVGIYPEIKSPKWHRSQGHDISRVVLKILSDYGYQDASDAIFLQCFEADELKRIKLDLASTLPRIQLLSSGEALSSPEKLKEIASYATGVGPSLEHLFPQASERNSLEVTIDRAHAAGLVIHPYTFRVDALPQGVVDFSQLIRDTRDAGIDGMFTDFPDICVTLLSEPSSVLRNRK